MKKDSCLRKTTFGMGFILLMVSALMLQIPETVGAQEEDEFVLEDTVVTATKTGETLLQETPIAITVFDDDALKSTHMFRLTELDDFIPNLVLACKVLLPKPIYGAWEPRLLVMGRREVSAFTWTGFTSTTGLERNPQARFARSLILPFCTQKWYQLLS